MINDTAETPVATYSVSHVWSFIDPHDEAQHSGKICQEMIAAAVVVLCCCGTGLHFNCNDHLRFFPQHFLSRGLSLNKS